MKCQLPDCAERFNASRKSEYGTLVYGANAINDTTKYDDYYPRKIKMCRKCMHRPIREVINSMLTSEGGSPLSEDDIREILDGNVIVDLDKGIADQI